MLPLIRAMAVAKELKLKYPIYPYTSDIEVVMISDFYCPDKFIDDINTALVDLKPWYKCGGYNKPYLTFNEYMTWSMVSLYAIDNYSAHDYKYIKNYTEKFMVNKRGFYKFKAFNNELIRLYKNKSIGKKITDLYPEIINWISKKSKST